MGSRNVSLLIARGEWALNNSELIGTLSGLTNSGAYAGAWRTKPNLFLNVI